MLYFFLFYFGVYGSMHLYFFLKCHQACGPEGWRLLALILFLLLMLNGPILVRFLERQGAILPATVLAWVSYIWMAALLWFICLGLVRDIWNAGMRLAALAVPASYRLVIPARPAFLVILMFIAAATVWGFVEGRGLRTETVDIRTDLLPAGSAPVKIAQISDVHIGLMEGRPRIKQILAVLHREKPDILLSTGDLVDGNVPHTNHLASLFAVYMPPLGKYAVTGNHEFYAGLAESLRFFEESGFTVLRGTSIQAGPIRIAGVDDPAGSRMGAPSYTDEAAALAMGNRSLFTVLMKHQPLVGNRSLGNFQLQLSGHTHKGQIFPFSIPVRMRFKYDAGLFDLGEGSMIYTSRGTGTWGPPLRVLSPAEVTIITVRSALSS
jgi:predicted MPP superfamily phosphohydrolase